MILHLQDEALAEFLSATAYYSEISTRLADDFVDEVEKMLNQISLFPQRFTAHRKLFRKALLKRFPYTIYFRVVGEDVIVPAIAHQSQKPDYWIARTAGAN